MPNIAIVGAGSAGLAAAWSHRQSGHDVTLFEKSRGLSGRAATRRRGECCYDHGANFFRTEDSEIHDLIHHRLPTDELVEIPGPVWTFDGAGKRTPGDDAQNALPKYTYRKGISTLGKLLAAASDPTIHRQTLITKLTHQDGEWFLEDEQEEIHGPFTHLLLTPPAPQTAALVNTISGQEPILYPLRTALGACEYHQQFSFILGFDQRLPRPDPFHALVNTDQQHALSWVSFEDDKPGHVPDGESVLMAQLSPSWSAHHYDTPPDQLLPEVLTHLATLLPDLPPPTWWDSQRWRYAHPAKALDLATLEAVASINLHLAGDALVGRGRIPLALKSGLEAARTIAAD